MTTRRPELPHPDDLPADLPRRAAGVTSLASVASQPSPRSLGYVPQLNGLRAVAIALVVFFHALGGSGLSKGGWVGVDVFFVLSGFLITAMLTGEAQRSESGRFSLGRFYLRRVLRLWPAYLAFLVGVGAYARLAHPHEFGSWAHELFVGLTYRMNFYYIHHDPHTGLGQIWTLCMEEQFYLLWPVVLLVCVRWLSARTTMVVTVVGLLASFGANVVLVADGASYKRLFFGPDTNAASLLIGCAFGLALTSGHLDRFATSVWTRRLPWVLACALGIWTAAVPETAVWQFAGPVQLLCLLSALTIVALVLNPGTLLGRFLANPAVVWIGVLSYSLYLWNQIALTVGPAAGTGLASHAVHYGVQLLLLVELPVLSYFLIERFGLRLKDRFERTRVEPGRHHTRARAGEPRSLVRSGAGWSEDPDVTLGSDPDSRTEPDLVDLLVGLESPADVPTVAEALS